MHKMQVPVVRFLYGTASGTYSDSILATQSPVTGIGATPVSAGLTGLTGAFTYFVRVSAANTAGYIRGGEENFTTNTPLPVELVTFTATSKRLTTELNWKTATEVNNYGFEVERSPVSDSTVQGSEQNTLNLKPESLIRQWTSAGFVQGAGSSNRQHDYSFVDNSAIAGRYAYRLKQIDRDGKFSFSQGIEVEVGAAPKVFELSQNYPNPFNPATTIEFTLPSDGRARLTVYNALGQEVETVFNDLAKAGEYYQAVFNARGLASGIYFARLTFEGKQQLKKMLLVK